MKINPDTLSLCEEFLNNPDAYQHTDDLITKCVSLEANDYTKAYNLLKRNNKVEEAVMMKLKRDDLIEFEKNSNPECFVDRLENTATYHKRYGSKKKIRMEIQEAFPEEKEIQDTIKLINTYVNVVRTRIWLKNVESKLTAIQNKIGEGAEITELLSWMNEAGNS